MMGFVFALAGQFLEAKLEYVARIKELGVAVYMASVAMLLISFILLFLNFSYFLAPFRYQIHSALSDVEYLFYNNGIAYSFFSTPLFLVFLFGAVYFVSVVKKPSKRWQPIFNRGFLVSVALLTGGGFLTNTALETAYERKQMEVCEQMNRRWLHSRSVVYVKNQDICAELIKQNVRGNPAVW